MIGYIFGAHFKQLSLSLADVRSNKETTTNTISTSSCPPLLAHWDFQHSLRTAATKRWWLTTRQSPLMSAIHTNCLRTANFPFMAYGPPDFQHSIRTAATKRHLRLANFHSCPQSMWTACELQICSSWKWLIYIIRTKTNALNACNVKWPVYSTNSLPIHINYNRTSKIVKMHLLLKFWY